MLIIAAIIGVIIGTIIFGIYISLFTFIVQADNVMNFFIGKWAMCCAGATVLVYGIMSDLGELLASVLPWILGIGIVLVVIIVIIGILLWALNQWAKKDEAAEEKKSEADGEKNGTEGETAVDGTATVGAAVEMATVEPEGKTAATAESKVGITTKLASDPVSGNAQNMIVQWDAKEDSKINTAYVLGIISVAMIPCGIVGFIVGIIGLAMAVDVRKKSKKCTRAEVLSIIGIILGIISAIVVGCVIAMII